MDNTIPMKFEDMAIGSLFSIIENGDTYKKINNVEYLHIETSTIMGEFLPSIQIVYKSGIS